MTHIPIPQRLNNKVEGDFYPLQKQELIALYKAKLINNVAFVHFALRYENPFCDRPITLIIKEFAMKWGISERRTYEALAKLKGLGIIKFNAGKVIVEWENCAIASKGEIPQKPTAKGKCGIPQKSAEYRNEMRNTAMKCEIPQNQPLEPLQGNDHNSPQTLQTDHTPQTKEEDQKKMTGLEEILNKEIIASSVPEKELVPRVVQNTTKSSNLTPEMSARLEAFGIPLDGAVTKAITNHHPSQVWGAIRHIENTWETIENPRAIFLYQVPKQPIEKPLKEPLTPEFLEWYNDAIANGTVKNISPEILPINQFREPKVYLPDNRLEDWQKVAAGEVEPLANPEQMADFFKKAREGLRNAAVKK